MISLLEKNGFSTPFIPFSDLETGKRDNIGLISLYKSKEDIKAHRQSGNGLDRSLMTELKTALALWRDDPSVKSIILTSSHKVAFSRGAAIEEVLGADVRVCRDFLSAAQDLLLDVQNYPKPIIAAINGLTLGGGFELALACDARIASTRENVIFGFPETSLGLIPAMGGTQNLRRIIGLDKARRIIGGAETDITVEKAQQLGIVAQAVSPGSLIEAAFEKAVQTENKIHRTEDKSDQIKSPEEIGNEIDAFIAGTGLENYRNGKGAPLAAALTDFIYEKTSRDHFTEGLLYEYEVFCRLQQTEDCQEGIKAMMEEREPLFKGR